MTVLVDTGVLYADHDSDASRHEAGRGAIDAVLRGEYGQPFVSEYVYDETVTLTRRRTGSFEAARTIGRRIRAAEDYPRAFDLVHLTESDFEAAVRTFERYDDQSLSFTDATSIALVERRDIDGVLSFDDDFDGLVTRFDPTECSV